MLGAPQILGVEPVGLAVVLIEDQTFQFPHLAAPYEVLCPQVSVPVSIHSDRVDCFHDLVEDREAVLFVEGLIIDVLFEIEVIGFCDISNYLLIGHLCQYLQEVFLEDIIFEIFQDFGVELETLIEAFLF